MPIYEFRCLKCNQINEFLFTSAEDQKELKCKECSAEDLERVMSCSNFTVGGPSSKPAAQASTQTCGSGSCGTLEIPGMGD